MKTKPSQPITFTKDELRAARMYELCRKAAAYDRLVKWLDCGEAIYRAIHAQGQPSATTSEIRDILEEK